MTTPLCPTCQTRYRIVIAQNTRPKLPGTNTPDKQVWWVCECTEKVGVKGG